MFSHVQFGEFICDKNYTVQIQTKCIVLSSNDLIFSVDWRISKQFMISEYVNSKFSLSEANSLVRSSNLMVDVRL